MKDYFRIYTCFDAEGNRYAIFGRIINIPTVDGTQDGNVSNNKYLEIWQWKCNKDDQYSKKFARQYYESYLTTGEQGSIAYKVPVGPVINGKALTVTQKKPIKPEIDIVEILTDKPGHEFIMYCKKKYFSIRRDVPVKAEIDLKLDFLTKGINEEVLLHPKCVKQSFKLIREITNNTRVKETE